MTNLEHAQEIYDEAQKVLATYAVPFKVKSAVETLGLIITEQRELRNRLTKITAERDAVSNSMNYSREAMLNSYDPFDLDED